MFNLLPESFKKNILSEYRIRKTILILAFLFLIQLSFLIFISPSWLLAYYREKEIKIQEKEINNSEVNLKTASTTEYIKSLNINLSTVNNYLSYKEVYPVLDTIISQKNDSVSINQFSYNSNSSTTVSISVQGISRTRESLVSFVDKIKALKYFKSVDFPVSNLAKEKDINFVINMVLSI